MATVKENLARVLESLPAEGVTLVAVSKFHPATAVKEAYDAGQRHFGESRAAELTAKAAELPADIVWHFIGHLQTNKVRPVVAAASVIQSTDSPRLLEAVEREALKAGKRVKVLMQVHVALEETKFGFLPQELIELMTPEYVGGFKAVEFAGVMGMASNTDDRARIAEDFRAIADVYHALRLGVFAGSDTFTTLSMGMSHDFPQAIDCGANMVRIGTDIFGQREY